MPSANCFDIAYVADCTTLRYCGECIADEVAIHSAAGYTTAIVPIAGASRSGSYSIGERIKGCAERGWAKIFAPGAETLSATLAIFPLLPSFTARDPLPTGFLNVDCALIVVDGTSTNSSGSIRSEIEGLAEWVEAIRPDCTEWRTTNADIRSQLDQSDCVGTTSLETWEPAVCANHWTFEPQCCARKPPVLGRYAIPISQAWPSTLEELLSFYPISGHVRVALVGAQMGALRVLGGRPRHWITFSYGSISIGRFLQRIDFFVDCMPSKQIPLGSANVLVSMASGVIPVLPANSASCFDNVVLEYEEPGEILEKTLGLSRDSESYRRRAENCRHFVFDNHGSNMHLRRLRCLIGTPSSRNLGTGRLRSATQRSKTKESSVLLVTSNGIGIGHLTRMLAIARRMRSSVLPVFATMSQAISIVRREGFHAEYLPFHAYANCSTSDWNRWLYVELLRIVRFFGVNVVVFDGHYPFDGLCHALSCRNGLAAVWCRRAMWPRALMDEVIDRTKFFDLVIEPGELAAEADVGATVPYRSETTNVEPITLLDNWELLTPDHARSVLGLGKRQTNVLLQLGSGNHIDIAPTIDEIVSIFSRIGDFNVTVAQWPNAEYKLDQWQGLRRLVAYPHARYLAAFDFVISACGYNSFHELIQSGTPSIFIPLELSYLDNQLARANYAAERSLGLCVRMSQLSGLEEAVGRMLDPRFRDEIRNSCAVHRFPNGADAAARIIGDLAR